MQVLSRQRGVSLIEVYAHRTAKSVRCNRSSFYRNARPTMGRVRSPAAFRIRRTVESAAQARGFSLIELMITLAVAVVLIAIAVPSFKTAILSNKLTTTSNDLVGAISAARMEAIKLNANAQLCSNSAAKNTSDTLGAACSSSAGAVIAMAGSTVVPLRSAIGGFDTRIKLNGDMAALRFDGRGLAHAVGTTTPFGATVANICTSAMSKDNNRRIDMAAGSIVTTTTTTGTCP